MDNDLGDHDVTRHAGGYNCAHEVMPVDKADAQDAQKIIEDAYGKTEADRMKRIDDLKERQKIALSQREPL